MEGDLDWGQRRMGASHCGNQGGRELLLCIIDCRCVGDDLKLKLVATRRVSPPFFGRGGGGGDSNVWWDSDPSGIEPAEWPSGLATPSEEQHPRQDASCLCVGVARTTSPSFLLIMAIGGSFC
jgi:hypothetical protein